MASTLAFSQLLTALHEQAKEIAALRAELDVQFKRIAQIQAELDLLAHAQSRRHQQLDMLMADARTASANRRLA
jgi:hypothetical protein